MMRLTLAAARAMLGRLGLPVALAWVFGAALFARDATEQVLLLGPYLAYVTLLPMLVLWRLGRLRRARRSEGWPAEERLRDPSGLRAPLAEAAATALLLTGALLLALLPPALPAFRDVDGGASLQPLQVRVLADGGWQADFAAPLPASASLILTVAFDAPPPGDALEIVDAHGQRRMVVPGEVLVFPLHAADARAGRALLRAADASAAAVSGARPLEALARVAVPRPEGGALAGILAGLLLWLLPLVGLLLALERCARVDGVLATVAALLVGSLAAARVDADGVLVSGALGALAEAVLAVRALLPDVSGLYAVGHRFELRAGTAEPGSTVAWLLVGAAALALACRRRRPRA